MKHGASFIDQNRIRRLADDGATAAEISTKLRIAPQVVKAFMPKKARAKKPEPVPVGEANPVEESQDVLPLGEDDAA